MRLRLHLFCSLALAVAMLVTSAIAQTPPSDVARTWTAAKVFVRDEPGPQTPAQIAVDKPLPVLIYLHGCGGLNDDNDLPWAKFIAQQGFIVVAPDRYARADHRVSCWPAQIPGILDVRREELTYALQQVRANKWADPANIFVMGFSEGADAVAGATPTGVRASVISSWTCSRVPVIALPASMPVLSIQWDNVPLHLGVLVNSNQACTHKFQDRAGFQRVTLRGKGHASYKEDSAREAVAQFLRDNLVHTAAAN